jgi:hexosaminidase
MPDNYSQKYTAPFLIPEDVLYLRVISYRDGKQIGKYLNIPIESLRKRAVKVL